MRRSSRVWWAMLPSATGGEMRAASCAGLRTSPARRVSTIRSLVGCASPRKDSDTRATDARSEGGGTSALSRPLFTRAGRSPGERGELARPRRYVAPVLVGTAHLVEDPLGQLRGLRGEPLVAHEIPSCRTYVRMGAMLSGRHPEPRPRGGTSHGRYGEVSNLLHSGRFRHVRGSISRHPGPPALRPRPVAATGTGRQRHSRPAGGALELERSAAGRAAVAAGDDCRGARAVRRAPAPLTSHPDRHRASEWSERLLRVRTLLIVYVTGSE